MNPIDTALQSVTPTVMVPRHEPFVPLQANGHRFLAASDGLWLEARRPWLYLCWPLVRQEKVAMPYGTLKQTLSAVPVKSHLMDEFIIMAQEVYPLECAAWVVWDEVTDDQTLLPMVPTSATVASVVFQRPRLQAGQHLLLDLHSHGQLGAFFSGQDNRDDRGEFKLAGVLGRVNTVIEAKFRLCANGLYVTLPDRIYGQRPQTLERTYERAFHPF
ncbi:PRTRC system protein A [Noviherbaspirillum galbum]|uniref:PRTRC system protein A n=1 Tax=Noviherbaspirillum galbum TaxID=2709383 RepID=A0A6B3SGY4_9BURK|nr:PRTRC system protein A [Noviherbaspirillum galbum]NEX60111.1 PRTRC system protein A [Noviherbaspirillum galbum]